MMGDSRYFENPCVGNERLGDVLVQKGTEFVVKDEIKLKFKSCVLQILNDIEDASRTFDELDPSVYTGLTGHALLYLHLYMVFRDPRYLNDASCYILKSLKRLKHRRISFLCGDAGPLAVATVVYHYSGQKSKAEDCLKQLLSMAGSVLPLDDAYDELLYGRAGYLYSLLFVRKYIDASVAPGNLINQVVDSMVESGKRKGASASVLHYTWHNSEYLGAAHGYIGILFLMLHTDYQRHSDVIFSTIDFIRGMQYKSGNFPSSYGSDRDRLIHWCHGAPGGVYLMIKAYEVLQDERYLKSAKNASEVVWQKGLLKKGYGLCHGAAGNGYGFLAMYRSTKDPKYLYRAVQFGLWCCDYKSRRGLLVPDRPYSLFEGISGTAYFLSDLMNPEEALFPGFEV